MLFTFKRDEEGRERIYVDDACVWVCHGDIRTNTGRSVLLRDGFNAKTMGDAIERADEAGFWAMRSVFSMSPFDKQPSAFLDNEVTVDVPVADNATATLSVTREGDES
jgi:hypothetical protein